MLWDLDLIEVHIVWLSLRGHHNALTQGLKQIKVTDKDACKTVHPRIQMGADTDIHWGG